MHRGAGFLAQRDFACSPGANHRRQFVVRRSADGQEAVAFVLAHDDGRKAADAGAVAPLEIAQRRHLLGTILEQREEVSPVDAVLDGDVGQYRRIGDAEVAGVEATMQAVVEIPNAVRPLLAHDHRGAAWRLAVEDETLPVEEAGSKGWPVARLT